MSEKRLFKFQQENDYKTAKRNHLITPNISTVVESGNTYINSTFVSKENAEAGDIIVYHEEDGEIKLVRYMKPEAFDSNDGYWTADAIVVVPFRHTNDGTVRAMALNYASTETPSDGGSLKNITWGADLTEDFGKYSLYTVFSSINGQTAEDTAGLLSTGSMPSDSLGDVAHSVFNPFDTETYYSQEFSTIVISSPYNNDGSKNEAYHSIGDFAEFTQNPLQDMDGQNNTLDIIKLLDTNYLQDTLYANSLVDNNTTQISGQTVNLYPCASACARYSSVLKPCSFDVTKTLDENIQTMPWYFPSAGEMGYFFSRLGRINYALEQIGKQPISLTEEPAFATSTAIRGRQAQMEKYSTFIIAEGTLVVTNSIRNESCAIPFCKF